MPDSLEEFFEFCQGLKYDSGGKQGNFKDYRLQAPEEVVASRVANCWDQTELQRYWFERHNYQPRTFLLYYYLRDDYCLSHSILVYKERGQWVWFEPMFHGTTVEYSGLHRYDDLKKLLKDFKRVFEENAQKNGALPRLLDEENWLLYEYETPQYGIPDVEFYEHCRKGKRYELR